METITRKQRKIITQNKTEKLRDEFLTEMIRWYDQTDDKQKSIGVLRMKMHIRKGLQPQNWSIVVRAGELATELFDNYVNLKHRELTHV